MIRPKTLLEWLMVSIIALATMIAITLPVFVIRSIENGFEDQIRETEAQLVAVNAATIACLNVSEEELIRPLDRVVADCIREVLDRVPSQASPED